jgi:class 3 adenylate cyclase/DNA-binding SARP family transcriptional activator
VLFSDLVASTELAVQLGDDENDALRRLHQQRQRDAITRHDGYVVKGLGDGIMAVFEGAAQAVAAAAELHEATTDLARRHQMPLALRVGVSAGDARSEAGDWYGTPVVEAARLCDAAGAGEVLVSDLVRRLAGSRTPHRFEALQPLALKGFEEPVATHRLAERDPAPPDPPRSSTEAGVSTRLVGTFGVALDGEPLADRALGSRKARTLLKVLAAARGRLVPMDALIEALWVEEPPRRAEANVATLVSRLRGALGAEAIDGGRHGYRLLAASSDVEDAEGFVEEAEARLAAGQPALALSAARAALEVLDAGSALSDAAGQEWAVELGREVERLLRRARSAGWGAGLAIGEARPALAWSQDAVAADPLDEDAHRAVIRCYHHLGEAGEALRAYERLRTVLAEELGADPGPETEALYQAVLRGEPVPGPDAAAAAASGDADVPGGLAGRQRERAALLDAWAAACRGTASCVLVTGEPGIGKSRLATEVAMSARSTGGVVLATRCFEAERSLFLQPVVELVRDAVAGLAPDLIRRAAADRVGPLAELVPEVGEVLRPVGYEPASGEIERRRVFEAVAAFLGGLARQRPLLVVLDDLHQAGASTVELLHFALRWDPTAPVLVVATVRDDEAGEVVEQLGQLSTRVEVGPLDEQAVRALAEAAGLADQAESVLGMTSGHTLFVVEALRALSEHRDEDAGTDAIPVPESLRAAVLARVARCGDEVEELLRAAAVVGSSFDLATVAELCSARIDDVAERAERARRAGILVEVDVRYELANDLIRDVLYDTTPAPVRLARHQRLAAMLSHQPEAAAGHAAAAGDLASAVACWLQAGTRALAAFATQEAEQLFARALDAAGGLDDPSSLAQAHLGRGRARVARGFYEAAREDHHAAQRLARIAGERDLEGTALTELAWCAYFARDMSRAEELAGQAAAHPHAGMPAQVLVGRLRNTSGDLPGAIAVLEPLVDPDADVDPAGRASALSCLGTALAHSDRYEHASATLEEAIELCRHTGVLRGLINARFFASFARTNLGDLAGGLRHAELLLAEVDRFELLAYHARALNLLAWSWRELGDLPRAHALAEEALERCGLDGDRGEGEPAANALLALAESALLAGDEAGSVRRLDDIEPLLDGHVGYGWRIELHRLELVARMDPPHAEGLLERARQHGSAKYEALALAHLGAAEEAAEVARATGSASLLARVAPEPAARRSYEAMAATLSPELRDGFTRHGVLARRFARA